MDHMPGDASERDAAADAGDVRDHLDIISFSTPDRVVESAWLAHAPFAFWLIAALRPGTLVELGTYRGFSYLTFCQAVAKLGLPTRCTAVDNWEGDAHSGRYGPGVLADLRRAHDASYSDFSTLIQSSFDDAVGRFADGSIDLLHIDGSHRYEDVRHDFELWRPKLSLRAVVLLHDTQEHEFGVPRLWSELKSRFPAFEFMHGHGLGVLSVGHDVPPKVGRLLAASGAVAEQIRGIYGRLGAAIENGVNLERSENKLAETSGTLARVREEARAAYAGAAHADAALKQKTKEASRLQSEADASKVDERRLKAALGQREAEIERLGKEIKRVKEEHGRLSGELVSAQATAERLPAALSSLDGALRQVGELEAHVALREAELAVAKSSLSWRIGAPLRWFGRTFPAVERTARIGAKFAWYTITFRLPAAIIRTHRRRRDRETIATLGGLDEGWYLRKYPDVALIGMHPLVHYVAHGAAEGRNPNAMFDTAWYLAQHPDVHEPVINPLAHYLKFGAAEGRNPGPSFDSAWYLAMNPDVRRAGLNPLVHYVQYGAAEGRATRPRLTRRKLAARPRRSRYDVVMLANIDWSARWQRPQQLAVQFARNGHRVFYVVAHPNTTDEPSRKYDALRVADDIHEIRLPRSCFFDRYKTAAAGQALSHIVAGIDELADDFDIADAIVHVHLASWTPVALALRDKWLWKVIYDCMDEWDGFPNIGAEVLTAEQELVRAADGVTVTGPLLMRKWGPHARRCEVVRNGVDYRFFQDHCQPNERFAFSRPVIGYYGAIAEWLDLDLLAEVAARNPQWQFVLAGDVFVTDLRGLDRLPNVKLLGLRPHNEMPELLWHFDVCLIPFKLNAMTHAVDPVKLYEYLSGGKPVVSVPLDEVVGYSGVITCATGSAEFTRAIEAALDDRDPERAQARRALAERNQWADRHARIAALVRDVYPPISIIVVTYNNCDLTRLCIESVLANTTHPNVEIIIVDNNSSDSTPDYLRSLAGEHGNIEVILNADNRGFAAANNQGSGHRPRRRHHPFEQ